MKPHRVAPVLLIASALFVIAGAVFFFSPLNDEGPDARNTIAPESGAVAPQNNAEVPRQAGVIVRKESPERAAPHALGRVLSPEEKEIYELADRDPAAAFALIAQRYKDKDALERWQAGVAAHLLRADFSKAPEVLKLVTDNLGLQIALMQVVGQAYRRDRGGVMTVIRDKLTGDVQMYALYNVVRFQVENDELLAAMQTQLLMSETSMASTAALQIAGKIGGRDLGAGLRWFEQLKSDSERKSAHGQFWENLMNEKDDVGLAELLAVTPPEETVKPGGTRMWNRKYIIAGIARLRQQSGDVAGIDALRTAVSGEEGEYVDVGIISADTAAPAHERMVRAAKLKFSWPRNDAIRSIIGTEVAKGYPHAAEFVLSLPDDTFGSALGALVSSWRGQDIAALNDWVRSLPAGPRREKAISNFVMSTRYGKASDKDLAREMISAADPQQREKLAAQMR